MTINIIKNAFTEGRETDVSWGDSQAKRDEIRLDVYSKNIDNFNGRIMHQRIALEQICPDTGKTLRTFGSRLDAARWIVVNVLKRSDPKNKKATSLTGNMQMCMAMGYKSYGYYWKTINPETHVMKLMEESEKLRSTPIFALDFRTKIAKKLSFPSIASAAASTGVSARQIRRLLSDGSQAYKGWIFREYNPTVIEKKFCDVDAAANFFGVKSGYINRKLKGDAMINNVKIIIEGDGVDDSVTVDIFS